MYLYRLSHVPALTLAELTALGYEPQEHSQKFCSLKEKIAIKNLGSVGYCAEIIPGKDYLAAVALWLDATEEKKKFVGIQLPRDYATQTEVIKKLKPVGAKKIAFLTKEATIGDWKRSNQIFFPLKKDGIIYAARIVEYFDQDLWAKLESSLPHVDMKRGQINIKLARTLLNFSPSKHIIDPFCGLGRNIIAGLDILTSAECSDNDEKAVNESRDNCKAAQERLGTAIPITFSVVAADAITLQDSSKSSIVTEGWLGENLTTRSTYDQALVNSRNVFDLYKSCFKHWNNVGITDVVLTFPYYPHLPELTRDMQSQLESAIASSGYKLATPGPHGFIHYARPNSLVGHSIFCLKQGK